MDKAFISSEITSAMRAHDKVRLSILRMVKNEIDTAEKDSKRELGSEEVIRLFKKVLKQTGETLEGSIKAGSDPERTALLQDQVDILTAYLPAQVTGDELLAVIERVLEENSFEGKRDMGKAIAAVVMATGGNCDKAEVAKIVGARLV